METMASAETSDCSSLAPALAPHVAGQNVEPFALSARAFPSQGLLERTGRDFWKRDVIRELGFHVVSASQCFPWGMGHNPDFI